MKTVLAVLLLVAVAWAARPEPSIEDELEEFRTDRSIEDELEEARTDRSSAINLKKYAAEAKRILAKYGKKCE